MACIDLLLDMVMKKPRQRSSMNARDKTGMRIFLFIELNTYFLWSTSIKDQCCYGLVPARKSYAAPEPRVASTEEFKLPSSRKSIES